jgi:hypothetical protein
LKCPYFLPAWKAAWILAGGDSHRISIIGIIRPGRGGGRIHLSITRHSTAPPGRILSDNLPVAIATG